MTQFVQSKKEIHTGVSLADSSLASVLGINDSMMKGKGAVWFRGRSPDSQSMAMSGASMIYQSYPVGNQNSQTFILCLYQPLDMSCGKSMTWISRSVQQRESLKDLRAEGYLPTALPAALSLLLIESRIHHSVHHLYCLYPLHIHFGSSFSKVQMGLCSWGILEVGD